MSVTGFNRARRSKAEPVKEPVKPVAKPKPAPKPKVDEV